MRQPTATGRAWAALALAIAVGASGPAPAHAALTATATASQPGWIGVRVTGGVPGSLVGIREGATTLVRIRLGPRGRARVARVAPWSCTQLVRTLTVHDRRGGVAEVRTETPACDRRLALRVLPRRPRAGGPLTFRLIDRWRQGGVDACVALVSPVAEGACHPARLRRRGTAVRLKAPRAGRYVVELRALGTARQRRLRIRPTRGRLALLATGDSMMAPVARQLRKAFSAWQSADVRTDVHYGAGISNSFVIDWREHALTTTPRWKPDVVVLFIGGHEGWPFGPVACCGDDWIATYAARTRDVVRAYMREGAAQAYVLSLPVPQEAARVYPLLAVNAGLQHAVAGLGPGARVIDLSAIFTPGFAYRDTMLVDGLISRVRAADGLHLTAPGGLVVTRAIVAALVADGILPARWTPA